MHESDAGSAATACRTAAATLVGWSLVGWSRPGWSLAGSSPGREHPDLKNPAGGSLIRAIPVGAMLRAAMCPVAILVTGMLALASHDAAAQHATAFDIEDGARAYQNVCANCHGPDGDLIAGIDLGRGMFRRPLTDDQIVGIILNGIENTPMPATPGVGEAQAREIVAWLRRSAANRVTSSDSGDAARGRALFEGAGQCFDCHRVAGRGARTGPDLTGIGLQRRAAELEVALLEPDALVQPSNRTYRVVPRGGEPVVGRLLNHDTFTVQLLDADERLRSFDKDALAQHGFIASPMPSYRDQFDAQQIADLVSYLSSLRGLER